MKNFLLAAFAIMQFSIAFAQPGSTKLFNFPSGGEQCQSATPYNGGFLLASAMYGNVNGTLENVLRFININDSVERSIRFGDEFHHYFHPVVTTTGNIFVFGVQTFSNSTEVNYAILDSNFNVLQQKKLVVPYSIIFCKFFRAKDGGVIGSVHELCDESRLFRLDADGNLVWIKSYVGIIVPPGGYDRTIINSINLYGGDRYLIAGHLGFGMGLFYFTIDDNGIILQSKIIETFFTGYNSDVMWRSGFDGEKLLTISDNATNGQDSTYLVEVDTGLNILHVKRLLYPDSTQQARDIISVGNEFVIACCVNPQPPFATTRIAISGVDKSTLAVNWTTETRCDTVQDATFYWFDGATDGNGVVSFLYNYGPLNWQTSSGNFDDWGLTKLDPSTHGGFCDAQNATATTATASFVVTSYYIDTIPHPSCSVMNIVHLTTTVALGVPVTICAVGIYDDLRADVLSAFPNPTSGAVMLSDYFNVHVYDATGKEILSAVNVNMIDLSVQPAGIYFLVIKNGEGKVLHHSKIIRE